VVSISGPVPLSTLLASSFGFLRMTSSVGVSGDMGMAAMVMPCSWFATAFRGLSAPDEGAGLPRGGVAAGRRAKAVLSSGIGGGWSRLRFGEGCASCIGISPVKECQNYMRTALKGDAEKMANVGVIVRAQASIHR
jgi:hypothetical protein